MGNNRGDSHTETHMQAKDLVVNVCQPSCPRQIDFKYEEGFFILSAFFIL